MSPAVPLPSAPAALCDAGGDAAAAAAAAAACAAASCWPACAAAAAESPVRSSLLSQGMLFILSMLGVCSSTYNIGSCRTAAQFCSHGS